MLTSGGIPENVSGDVEVFPDNKRFDGSHIQSFESILDTKAVFTRILADFIKVVLDQLLLLHELDIGERFRCELNSLLSMSGNGLCSSCTRTLT